MNLYTKDEVEYLLDEAYNIGQQDLIQSFDEVVAGYRRKEPLVAGNKVAHIYAPFQITKDDPHYFGDDYDDYKKYKDDRERTIENNKNPGTKEYDYQRKKNNSWKSLYKHRIRKVSNDANSDDLMFTGKRLKDRWEGKPTVYDKAPVYTKTSNSTKKQSEDNSNNFNDKPLLEKRRKERLQLFKRLRDLKQKQEGKQKSKLDFSNFKPTKNRGKSDLMEYLKTDLEHNQPDYIKNPNEFDKELKERNWKRIEKDAKTNKKTRKGSSYGMLLLDERNKDKISKIGKIRDKLSYDSDLARYKMQEKLYNLKNIGNKKEFVNSLANAAKEYGNHYFKLPLGHFTFEDLPKDVMRKIKRKDYIKKAVTGEQADYSSAFDQIMQENNIDE